MPEEGTIPRYWIQKNRNIVRESHQNHKVFTKQFPVSKETHKLRILKPKDFITLQNILFVYDCLEKERMKSFNTIFKQMDANQFHNTRSFNAHQLKKWDFKTEKYGPFSILIKCLSDWEPTPRCFKN